MGFLKHLILKVQSMCSNYSAADVALRSDELIVLFQTEYLKRLRVNNMTINAVKYHNYIVRAIGGEKIKYVNEIIHGIESNNGEIKKIETSYNRHSAANSRI